MSHAPSSGVPVPPRDARAVLRALAGPGAERADELLAWCLRVADELGFDEHERVVLGRAAQLQGVGVPRAEVLPPELSVAARVARRAATRWDATREDEVPRICHVLAACSAFVDGRTVEELRTPDHALASEVIDALAAVAPPRSTRSARPL